MRSVTLVLAMISGLLVSLASAQARVDIRVDLAGQTMEVSSGSGDYVWPISSARAGYRTPRGSYGVQRMEAMHRSHKYHDSPMPHSLFFSGGYAIHGTYAVGALGRPASHGCIRIAPENAAALYRMVRAEGARITITGGAPASRSLYASHARHGHYAQARRQAPELRGGYDGEPSGALGYDRVPDASLTHWWGDPAGM